MDPELAQINEKIQRWEDFTEDEVDQLLEDRETLIDLHIEAYTGKNPKNFWYDVHDGHTCTNSPIGICAYDRRETTDLCIFCGDPEDRP